MKTYGNYFSKSLLNINTIAKIKENIIYFCTFAASIISKARRILPFAFCTTAAMMLSGTETFSCLQTSLTPLAT